MKEFRHIMMIFALVALAAGCSKVEVVNAPGREISFTVGSYAPATKAVAVTEFNNFSSKGYLHAEGVDGTQDFFGVAGETITFNGTDTWAPSHPYYWPKGANSYINFVSWYDKNGEPTTSTETSLVWEIDGANRTLASDDNILVADKAWYQKENVENYYTPGVPTLFKHMLAQVSVKAKTTIASNTVDGVTNQWSVSVSNFKINGVYTTGTLSLTNSEEPATGNTTPWTGSWNLSGSTKTSIDGPDSSTTLNTSGEYIINAHSVLPQSILGMSISFDYEVTTTSTKGNKSITVTEKESVKDLLLSSFTGYTGNWDMNKKITYNITINPQTGVIVIAPEVVEWTNGGTSIGIE